MADASPSKGAEQLEPSVADCAKNWLAFVAIVIMFVFMRTPKLLVAFALIAVLTVWCATPFVVAHYYGWPDGPGTFGDLFGSVNALFSALAFAALIYTVILQREELAAATKSFLADHERRRMEATLAALESLRPELKAFSLFLDGIAGHRQNIKTEHIAELKVDVEKRTTLHSYIEKVENLAMALNLKLYDDDLCFRLTGPFLTNLWARIEPYIMDFRHDWPTVASEFDDLAVRYRKLAKGAYSNRGLRHVPPAD